MQNMVAAATTYPDSVVERPSGSAKMVNQLELMEM
jgi:hypothetical protein